MLKKIYVLCMMAILTTINPSYDSEMYVTDGTEGISDVTIGFYQDDSQIIYQTSDEDGMIQMPITQGWMKSLDRQKGLYDAKESVVIEEGLVYQVEPIHVPVVNDTDETLHCSLYENDALIHTYEIEKELDIGKDLFCDGTYVLKIDETDDGIHYEDVEIVVPKYKEEERIYHIGEIKKQEIQFQNAYPPITLKFYVDEDCTIPYVENDLPYYLEVIDETSHIFPEGKYWYQYEDIPDAYYEVSDIFTLEVKEENSPVEIQLTKPEIRIQWNDDVPYTCNIIGSDVNEEWINDGKQHSFYVNRDADYTLSCIAPENYYSYPAQTIHVSAYEEELSVITMESLPFSITFQVVDDETNITIPYTVNFENITQDISWSESVQGLLHVSAKENDVIRYHVMCDDGYMYDAEGEITIGNDASYDICVYAHAYSYHAFSFLDEEVYGIYMDQVCVTPAVDVYGNQLDHLSGTQTLLLSNGTYYLKQLQSLKGYYPNNQIQRMNVSHDNLHQEHITPQEKATAQILVVNQYGEHVEGVSVEIRDGADVYEVQDYYIDLEAGKTYQLVQKSSISGHLNATPSYIQMPAESVHAIPTFYLRLTKYQSIHFQYEGDEKYVLGSRYGLYTEEQCTNLVKDIDGTYVDFEVTENDIYRNLSSGIYYLKQLQSSTYSYQDANVYTVDCTNQNNIEVELITKPVSFQFQLTNTQGKKLSGAQMELYDEDNHCIYTWTTTESDVIPEGLLQRGKHYRIHQVTSSTGYQIQTVDLLYSIPDTMDDSFPLVTMMNERSERKVRKVKDMEEIVRQKQTSHWLIGISILLGVIALCKFLHKMKKS